MAAVRRDKKSAGGLQDFLVKALERLDELESTRDDSLEVQGEWSYCLKTVPSKPGIR